MSDAKDFLDPDEQAALEGTNEDMGESMVMDLEDVDESMPAFEALPPATYPCIVENTEFQKSKNGNPMIVWTFKVTDPQYDGRLLFNHTVLNNEVGKSRLKQILVRVVPDLDLKNFNPVQFCEEGSALGLPCRVKVKIRPYRNPDTGKTEKRNNVTDVLPPADDAGAFLDEGLGE